MPYAWNLQMLHMNSKVKGNNQRIIQIIMVFK